MKAEQQRLPRFAVLIDADNTSPQIAGGLFEEVAKFGEASVRRIYGDFSGGQLKSWADILQEHAIDPYQQFAYTKGKNASDIALVIDAMDLLAQRPVRRVLPGVFRQRFYPARLAAARTGRRRLRIWRGENTEEFSPGVPPLHLDRESVAAADRLRHRRRRQNRNHCSRGVRRYRF